jgi:hypothetical protein
VRRTVAETSGKLVPEGICRTTASLRSAMALSATPSSYLGDKAGYRGTATGVLINNGSVYAGRARVRRAATRLGERAQSTRERGGWRACDSARRCRWSSLAFTLARERWPSCRREGAACRRQRADVLQDAASSAFPGDARSTGPCAPCSPAGCAQLRTAAPFTARPQPPSWAPPNSPFRFSSKFGSAPPSAIPTDSHA